MSAIALLLDRVGLRRGLRLGDLAPASRTALVALFTASAYYVGMQVGFQAKFPGGGPSILWPPNALLLSVLLATPARKWAVYLLAPFPVHVVTALDAGFPLPLLLGLFLTNSGQALLGAVLVRRLLGARIDFDSLRHVIVFIAMGAGLAPFVSSFADVAMWVAAEWPQGIRYWPAWAIRFASNALTILVVSPILVLAINRSRGRFHRPLPGRFAEATVLAMGLAAAGLLIGVSEPSHVSALMYTPLPLLLWAAVRFGPAGVSGSLFAITLCMTIGASRLLESLAERREAAQSFSLQFFIVTMVTAVSLMLLAAVIRERAKAEIRLREQLGFERLLSEVSAGFAERPAGRLDEAIRSALERIVGFLEVDRAAIGQPSADGRSIQLTHAVRRPGVEPPPAGFLTDDFPWTRDRLLRGQVVHFSRVADLPVEASTDRAGYQRVGVRSALMVPLIAAGTHVGILGFSCLRGERTWSGGIVERLRLLGEIVTATLMRQRADSEAREEELLNRAVLASVLGAVAVVDRHGVILRANETWNDLARAYGRDLLPELLVGGNYLEACRRLAQLGIQGQVALEAMQAVLAGASRGFSLEYAWPRGTDGGWAEMLAVPLERPAGGAVVTHHDITRRKRNELEAQQHRQSLAHAARVLAVGELAGSIGHELNQPLTAIVSNAQAAQRLLSRPTPDLIELHEILGDIAEDGKRGGEVIRGLRGLLRRSEARPVAVNMKTVVGEVVTLLRGDTIAKGIAVRVDVSPELPTVIGDRVQLQQVVLNLFMNAYDAMAGSPSPHELAVQLRPCPVGLELLVSDSGPVLPEEALERMFEPFFTTKPEGLGMGLSISRTIVRAHGGDIRAWRNPERGITVCVTLPGGDGRGGRPISTPPA